MMMMMIKWHLKLLDQFIYLGSNISSTESNVNRCIGKPWIAIDRLSIIWKSNLANETKQEFFQAVAMSVLLYSCMEKKLEENLHKNATCCFEQILDAKAQKTVAASSLTSHVTNHPSQVNKTWCGLLKKSKEKLMWHSLMNFYTWTHLCWPTSRTYIHQLCVNIYVYVFIFFICISLHIFTFSYFSFFWYLLIKICSYGTEFVNKYYSLFLLSIYLSIYLLHSIHFHLIYLLMCKLIHLSIYLSIYLLHSIFIYLIYLLMCKLNYLSIYLVSYYSPYISLFISITVCCYLW